MKSLRWIAVVVLLLVGGVWWSWSSLGETATDWTDTERGDLLLSFEVTGSLKAVKTDLIGPPQLRSMWRFKIAQMAPEGEEVAPGTPVLAFDSSELQQRLQREMAERDAARKRVEKTEKELALSRRQELLRQAESEAALGKAELAAASPEEFAAAKDLALVRLDQ